jgi:beta-mannosidase
LNVSLLDFEGNKVWSQRKDIEIAPLNSRLYLTVPINTLLAGKDAKGVFLFTEVLVGGKPVSSNEHFFQPYKNLSLLRPQIDFDVVPIRGGFQVTLSADRFARAVYLSAPNYAGFFTDNYFDLIPGRKVEVQFRTGAAVAPGDFRSKLKIRTMADAF